MTNWYCSMFVFPETKKILAACGIHRHYFYHCVVLFLVLNCSNLIIPRVCSVGSFVSHTLPTPRKMPPTRFSIFVWCLHVGCLTYHMFHDQTQERFRTLCSTVLYFFDHRPDGTFVHSSLSMSLLFHCAPPMRASRPSAGVVGNAIRDAPFPTVRVMSELHVCARVSQRKWPCGGTWCFFRRLLRIGSTGDASCNRWPTMGCHQPLFWDIYFPGQVLHQERGRQAHVAMLSVGKVNIAPLKAMLHHVRAGPGALGPSVVL